MCYLLRKMKSYRFKVLWEKHQYFVADYFILKRIFQLQFFSWFVYFAESLWYIIIAHDSILYYKRYKIGKASHRTKLFLTVKRECDNNFKQLPPETKFSHQLYFILHRPVKFDFYYIWQWDSRVLRLYAIMLTKVWLLIIIHYSFLVFNYIQKRIKDIQHTYNLKLVYSMWILDNKSIIVSR